MKRMFFMAGLMICVLVPSGAADLWSGRPGEPIYDRTFWCTWLQTCEGTSYCLGDLYLVEGCSIQCFDIGANPLGAAICRRAGQ